MRVISPISDKLSCSPIDLNHMSLYRPEFLSLRAKFYNRGWGGNIVLLPFPERSKSYCCYKFYRLWRAQFIFVKIVWRIANSQCGLIFTIDLNRHTDDIRVKYCSWWILQLIYRLPWGPLLPPDILHLVKRVSRIVSAGVRGSQIPVRATPHIDRALVSTTRILPLL